MENTVINKFIKYTSQNILGMIGISCYILADTFFISRGLGSAGLTALNIALPAYSFIHGTGLMIGIGGGTVYSISKARRSKSAENIFTYSVILTAVFAAVFLLSGIFFPGNIARLLGADNSVFHMSRTYIQVLLIFSPAFMLNNLLLCFVRNDNGSSTAMTAMIAGSLSNIILDYIFIFPLNMGIFGAAAATGISPVISICLMSRFFIKNKNSFSIKKCRFSFKLSRSILSSGLPSLITEVSGGIVIMIFNMIILNISGNIGVAAYGIVANISLVVMSIFTGLSQGIQPLISESFGKNNIRDVYKILKYSLSLAALISISVYALIFFANDIIVDIFNSEKLAQLQSLGETGLKYYFTAIFFAGVNIIMSIFFTSTESPLPAHIISFLRGFVLIIPCAFILSYMFKMTGVYMAFPVSEFISFIIGIIIYTKKRKHI